MAARPDKSGKPTISMRFSDMSSLDDDDDLDLFTAKNLRAKPGTSGVTAPSAREMSAKRPTHLHDNKKDSTRSIFGEIKGKMPASLSVISRKLEEMSPEEKFRDVKDYLARKTSDDSRNQPPLPNLFETDDDNSIVRKDSIGSRKSSTGSIKSNNEVPKNSAGSITSDTEVSKDSTGAVKDRSVVRKYNNTEVTKDINHVPNDDKKDDSTSSGEAVTGEVNGVHETLESSVESAISEASEDRQLLSTAIDAIDPIVPHRPELQSEGLMRPSACNVSLVEPLSGMTSGVTMSSITKSEPCDSSQLDTVVEPDFTEEPVENGVSKSPKAEAVAPKPTHQVSPPPKAPETLPPHEKALPPPTPDDPLNVFLRELSQRKDDSSDVDSPHHSPMKTSPKLVPKTAAVVASSTPKSGSPKADSLRVVEKFVDPTGELSDDEFEPMEDFFGNVSRRISDDPQKEETPRRSISNSLLASSENKSMSFKALKSETNISPVEVKSLDDASSSKEKIKNVSETLNRSSENLMKDLAGKPKFGEHVLVAPTTNFEVGASSLKYYWKSGAFAFVLLAYALTPLPSYVSGLIMGALISGVCMTIYILATKPPRQKEAFSVTELNSLPPFLLPEIKDCRFDEGIYKGWMNELSKYDAENYHINDTSSVFVTLEGSCLRLQRPKLPVPKRAMWNESISSAKFIHQRYYDIIGAKVTLEPMNLVKKRLWSKKYPLCVTIKTDKKDLERSGRVTSSPSKDDVMDFEIVDKSECNMTLYLFSRTCREKEEWYRRFLAAARGQPLVNHLPELSKLTYANNAQVSFQNVDELISKVSELREDFKDCDKKRMVDYARFMAKFMPAEHMMKTLSCSHKDLTRLGHVICDSQLMWLNAFIGRVLWDMLREKFWADKVYERIQKKLSKIHVPIFINEITIKDLELGTEVPIIRRASKPYLDARGLWLELDLAYAGGFKMTLETKCNLMKLKKVHGGTKLYSQEKSAPEAGKSAVFNSEEEDSCESSTEEEDELPAETENGERLGAGGGKKIMRIMDKITNSKYFQQATENKYIRRAMEGVSNTPLVLSVEVHSLVGTLAVNLPAPPTDRIWYGFRTNPRLVISAKPKVGDRRVTVTHVTEWIERKIASEFQKILVLPNMDDIPIPVMNEGLVNNS